MNAALSLFKKDLRRLWPLALLCAIVIFTNEMFPFFGPVMPKSFATDLLWLSFLKWPLGGLFALLAVGSDPILGESPFWRTRPISAAALILGKALLLASVVLLPAALPNTVRASTLGLSPLRTLEVIGLSLGPLLATVAIPSLAALATTTFATGLFWSAAGGLTSGFILAMAHNSVRANETYNQGVTAALSCLALTAWSILLMSHAGIARRPKITVLLSVAAALATIFLAYVVFQMPEAEFPQAHWVPERVLGRNITDAQGDITLSPSARGFPQRQEFSYYWRSQHGVYFEDIGGDWGVSGTDDTADLIVDRVESALTDASGHTQQLIPVIPYTYGQVQLVGDGPYLNALGLRKGPRPWTFRPLPVAHLGVPERSLFSLFAIPVWTEKFVPTGRLTAKAYFQSVNLLPLFRIPARAGEITVLPGHRIEIVDVFAHSKEGASIQFDERYVGLSSKISPYQFLNPTLVLVNQARREYCRSPRFDGIRPINGRPVIGETLYSFRFDRIKKDGADTGRSPDEEWLKGAEIVLLAHQPTGNVRTAETTVDSFTAYESTYQKIPLPTHRTVKPAEDQE